MYVISYELCVTGGVLSVLLVLRVEIVNRICHDVPWVHGFLETTRDALHSHGATGSTAAATTATSTAAQHPACPTGATAHL